MDLFDTFVRRFCLVAALAVLVPANAEAGRSDAADAGRAGGPASLDLGREAKPAPCGVRLVSGAVVPHALRPRDAAKIVSECVEVRFDVRADGSLENIRIPEAVPEALRARVLALLEKARFTPALASGNPADRRDVSIALVLTPGL